MQNVAWTWEHTTITSAQVNLYFAAAIMLPENDVFIDQFTEQVIADPKVPAMIERIAIAHAPSLDGKHYDTVNPVEVELTDGTGRRAVAAPPSTPPVVTPSSCRPTAPPWPTSRDRSSRSARVRQASRV
jgi:2-methylcitrate dehydratase PrpD